MIQPVRVCLGWERPFLPLMADWLLERRAELPEMLVVVPTAQSGRLLRERLAADGGVLAPRVTLPEGLLRAEQGGGRLEELMAWVEVLRSTLPGEVEALFPGYRPPGESEEGFSWALSLARTFSQLRSDLTDAGQGIGSVARLSEEPGRWDTLERMEEQVRERMRTWRVTDPIARRRARASEPELPAGVRQVVVAGVPDPLSLVVKAWERLLERGIAVTVLVHAPGEDGSRFDEWGRPTSEGWGTKVLPMGPGEIVLKVCDDPAVLGEEAVRQVASSPNAPPALGMCDESMLPGVTRAFGEAGWNLFDPAGRKASATGLFQFLRALRDWIAAPQSFERVRRLLHWPEGWKLVGERNGYLLVNDLGTLHRAALPETLARAAEVAADWRDAAESGRERQVGERLVEVFVRLERAAGGFHAGRVAQRWRAVLKRLFAGRDDALAVGLLESIEDGLEVFERLEGRGFAPRASDVMDVILASVAGLRLYDEPEGAAAVSGWLELIYEEAGKVLLLGLHEGSVPDGKAEDAWIPDGLRRALGMRNEESRWAREAFLAEAMVRCRGKEEVRVLVSKTDSVGEPLRASRLLTAVEAGDLPDRVRHLFDEANIDVAARPPAVWARDWELERPFERFGNPYSDQEPAKTLGPTSLKDYLLCPLRFYLRHVVGMRREDPEKRELDARDFGTLLHDVLEAFGVNETLRDSDSEEEIAEFLLGDLRGRFDRAYGSALGLPLMVQLDSAEERLKAFARLQAQERRDGWRIREVEMKVGYEIDWAFAGHPIRMKVDRIDHHPEHGWRILDYKTSSSVKDPDGEHLASWRDGRRELGPVVTRGRWKKVWRDVQLPLYAAFVREHFELDRDTVPLAGYVALPRAVSHTQVKIWRQLDEGLLESALEWTREAIRRIREGDFAPVEELGPEAAKWDEFAELAPDGLGDAFGMGKEGARG